MPAQDFTPTELPARVPAEHIGGPVHWPLQRMLPSQQAPLHNSTSASFIGLPADPIHRQHDTRGFSGASNEMVHNPVGDLHDRVRDYPTFSSRFDSVRPCFVDPGRGD